MPLGRRIKMTEIKEWCVTSSGGGRINYRATHRFMPYETWILRTPMYYCKCGKKIKPEEYIEYSKYLVAREKALDAYMKH